MKIVINAKPGAFGLSEVAVKRYCQMKGIPVSVERGTALTGARYWLTPPSSEHEGELFCPGQIHRTDPVLVQVVEKLGRMASGRYADLKVVQIPDDVQWELCERDGDEWIAEVHRTWR
jgi:hypothetical protein